MEPISTAALAALILASRSGAEEFGKEAGHSTWTGLGRLKTLVREKFAGSPEASQALEEAEQKPEDEQVIARLRDSLEGSAARDSVFAAELQQLVDEARSRPEYQRNSALFANYGYTGKINIFNGSIHVEHGGFNIN